MVDWTINLHSKLSDEEIEELVSTASKHGVSDCIINHSGRLIHAETEREDEAINWIVAWLADSLYCVQDIACITEKREYWPIFEEQEVVVRLDFSDEQDN